MRLLPLVILASGLVCAQDDPAQLLKRVSETYKQLKSYHFESEYQGELTGEWQGSWTKGRTTLAVASPDRVRFEMVDHTASYTVVSDGKTLWRAAGYAREYTTSQISGPLLATKGGGQEAEMALRRLRGTEEQHWNLDENLKQARILRKEAVDVQGIQIPCVVVRAEYASPHATHIASATRTFWIDTKRNLLLEIESVATGNLFPDKPFERVENRSKLRYTLVSINEPPPDALFTWTPPDNFREVDTLESPMRRTAAKDMTGKPAPELTATTLDGAPMTLSSMRGHPVLLDFWATWCVPCRNLMPGIAGIYRETKDQGLVLLGIDDDETPEKALAWLKENHYDWPSMFDGKTRAAREKFKVSGIPTVVLIDGKGQIAEYLVGGGAETEKAIRVALRKQGIHVR